MTHEIFSPRHGAGQGNAGNPYPNEITQIGPYRLLENFTSLSEGIHRALARTTDTGRCCVIAYPSPRMATDEGYRLRFWAEAKNSGRLASRCLTPVADASAPADVNPWVSYEAFPAVPLATALTLASGELPWPVVNDLGVALAEVFLRIHSQGLAFAGLSPESLLLTPAGPRLTGYGLVRAASPEGMPRQTVPGVPAESVPPEQRTGDRPEPFGDVYAVGTVLAYAATGRFARAVELAEPVREAIGDCLEEDPRRRPGVETLARRLRDFGGRPQLQLPEPVLGILNEQAAQHPTAPPPSFDQRQPQPHGTLAGNRTTLTRVRKGLYSGTELATAASRRTVVRAGVAGAVGLAAGAGGVLGWRAYGLSDSPRPWGLAKAGAGPAPLWRYESSGGELGICTVAGGRVAVFGSANNLTAVDLRNGTRLWSRDDISLTSVGLAPIAVSSDGILVLDHMKFSLVSLHTGKLKWSEKRYSGVDGSSYTFSTLLGARKDRIWFLASDYGGGGKPRYKIIAFRVADRKELWRTEIPDGFTDDYVTPRSMPGPVIHGGELLVPNTGINYSDSPFGYLAFDLRSGRRRWKKTYKGLKSGITSGLRVTAPENQLVAEEDKKIYGYDLRTGKVRWRVKLNRFLYSDPVLSGHTLYISDEELDVRAVDTRQGKVRWRTRGAGVPHEDDSSGKMALSASHQTLLRTTDSEIDALRVADGRPRWRMAITDVDSSEGKTGDIAGVTNGMMLVSTKNSLYAFPVD